MRIVETPIIEFADQNWTLAYSYEMPGVMLNEYTLDDSPAIEWSEFLSTITQLGLQNQLPRNLMANTVKTIQEKIINGTLNSSVLYESDEEIIYTWSIVDDLVAGDQFEIIRVFRGTAGVHSIHYSVRGILYNPGLYDDWIGRLKSVRLTETVRPEIPAPTDARVESHRNDDEIKRILCIVQEPSPDTDVEKYVKLCRKAITLIDKNAAPDMWGIFHYLLGIFLAKYPENPSHAAVEEAIAAYRQTLRVITMDRVPQVWAKTMRNLAEAFLNRFSGRLEKNFEQAVTGYLQAFKVFSVDTLPEEWGSTMLSLGRAYKRLGETGDSDAFRTAISIYNTILAEIGTFSSFIKVDPLEVVKLLATAERSIYGIDVKLSGNPPLPSIPKDVKGTAIFLRSFQTSRTLSISNGFKRKSSSNSNHLRRLDTVNLEAALYAALWPTLIVHGIGGPTDSFGAGRFYTTGDNWQDMLKALFEVADILVIVPHISDGLRWEVEFLIENDGLPKCLFVMPPSAENFDVGQMWQDAAGMMLEYGLHIPQYTKEGMLFTFGSNNQVLETLSFDNVWNNTLMGHLEHLLTPIQMRKNTKFDRDPIRYDLTIDV